MHAREVEPAAPAPARAPAERERPAPALGPDAVLHLQRTAGNASVQALLDDEAGSPLDAGARTLMEDRLGSDFSDVRVHTGPRAEESARSINAAAYTVGRDVVFGAGHYAPDTLTGQRTLAHELTHVVQQRSGPVDGTPAPGGIRLSDPSDRFEQAAERAAEQAISGLAPVRQREPEGGAAVRVIQRQVAAPEAPPLTASPLTLEVPSGSGLQLPEAAIDGPLPPGQVVESHGLTVTQVDPQRVEIAYGPAWIHIQAAPEDAYTFSIGPPIATPPGPQISLPDPGSASGFGPATPLPPDLGGGEPELPQRLVRIAATRVDIVEQYVPSDTRVAPLALQSTYMAREALAAAGSLTGAPDVIESAEDDHAQLQLEDTILRIEVAADAGDVAGEAGRARFAYWIDPEWTGPDAAEKRVIIVAAPGVRTRTWTSSELPPVRYGRRLVDEVIRVPHPDLVPPQGTRLAPEDFVHVEVASPGVDAPGDAVQITTGLAGVVVVHPWSGARLTIEPTDPELGAAYAWQVLPPVNGVPGEIRAVVGPGVTVGLDEPVPNRLRAQEGATPTPTAEEAQPGEGLQDQSFELQLVEVPDPALVPVQGTPLNIEHFLEVGARQRGPDRHSWLGADDSEVLMAHGIVDAAIGMIPIAGQLYMIGELAYTMVTDHNFWGDEIGDTGKVLMGVGAALSLLPLAGGLSALLRGAAKAVVLAEWAARWGTTAEELQAVLVRVGMSAQGSDAAVVARAVRALQEGGDIAADDVPVLQTVLARVGAADAGLQGLVRTGLGQMDLAVGAAGQPVTSESFLTGLVFAYRTTGEIRPALVVPLARQLGTAEQVGPAVQQALRDLARAEGVVANETEIAEVAAAAARARTELTASGVTQDVLAEAATRVRAAAAQEPVVSSDIEAAAAETGGTRVGAGNVLKTEASLARKIAGDIKSTGLTPTEAGANIKDSLRYTITYPTATYTDEVEQALDTLRAKGYSVARLKPSWEPGSRYYGINVILRTQEGYPFELQFHTPESFELKMLTHDDFDLFRTTDDPAERAAAEQRMIAATSKLVIPPGVERIKPIP